MLTSHFAEFLVPMLSLRLIWQFCSSCLDSNIRDYYAHGVINYNYIYNYILCNSIFYTGLSAFLAVTFSVH